MSRPPQGRPVFILAGASARGKKFAARWADVIFVAHASLDSAKAFYQEMKGLAVEQGRDPSTLAYHLDIDLGQFPQSSHDGRH